MHASLEWWSLVAYLIACATGVPSSLRQVNEFEVKSPAVANFGFTAFPHGPSLLLTSFHFLGSDHIYAVPGLTKAMGGGAVDLVTIDDAAVWPNYVAEVAPGAIRSAPNSSLLLTVGGFFACPWKATGEIALHDVTDFLKTGTIRKTVISTPEKDNFYHQAQWLDVDGDGLLDILAARAHVPVLHKDQSEGSLVWLKQPAQAGEPWVEQRLTSLHGPDVQFVLTDLNGDGKLEVVAAQFLVKQQLAIWSCNAAHWSECAQGRNVQVDVVDDSEDAGFFCVEWVDLNGDGKKELIATTNSKNGSAYVYEQINGSSSLRDFKFKKHTIATGYVPTQPYLPGRGAPGRIRAFKAHKDDSLLSIIISGDDAGVMDLLTPDATATKKFQYTRTRFVDIGGTIGSHAVADIDDDGYAEVVVPKYSKDLVTLFSFSSSEQAAIEV